MGGVFVVKYGYHKEVKMKRSESRKDLTIGGVGITLNF